jgi:hypothetical protein
LVSLEQRSGRIEAIDPCTGMVTALGSVGPVNVGSTAPIPDTSRAWAVDYVTHDLLQLDLCSGQRVRVGPTGGATICGLTLDDAGALLGLDRETDSLLRFDTATGAATVVGPLGFDLGLCGMAYDPEHDRLLAIDSNSRRAFAVDARTGRVGDAVPVDVPKHSVVGVEYHPGLRALLFSDGKSIYTVDPETGEKVLASPIRGPGMHDDLAFTPGPLRCE